MTIKITEECLACGSCSDSCPSGAILEGDEIFTISADCSECGTCVEACPVGAIIED